MSLRYFLFTLIGLERVPTFPSAKATSPQTAHTITQSPQRLRSGTSSATAVSNVIGRDKYLSLFFGFDHVIGNVVVDGSGWKNDGTLTTGLSSLNALNIIKKSMIVTMTTTMKMTMIAITI